MTEQYAPHPDWTQRDLKAIEMYNLYNTIVNDIKANKSKELENNLVKYDNIVREDVAILGEYPILLNNNNNLISLINAKSHEMLGKHRE